MPGRSIGLDERFDEAGGDSLAVLRLIAAAAERGIELSVAAIEAMGTIRKLAAAIDAGNEMRDSLTCKYLRERTLPLAADVAGDLKMDPNSPPQSVLVTGASGFLGSALLIELLKRAPDLQITCLVRGGSIERIAAAMQQHGTPATAQLNCLERPSQHLQSFAVAVQIPC